MHRTIAGLGVAVIVTLAAAEGLAQTQTLEPGTRVRITRKSGSGTAFTGSLVAVRGDTLLVEGDSSLFSTGSSWFTWNQVKSIDRSVGSRTQGLQGALVGGFVGAGLGAALGYVLGDDDPTACVPANFGCATFAPIIDVAKSKSVVAQEFGVTGAVIGVLVGSLIGLNAKTDAWQAVQLADGRPRVEFRSSVSGKARVGISFAFGSAPRD